MAQPRELEAQLDLFERRTPPAPAPTPPPPAPPARQLPLFDASALFGIEIEPEPKQ